MKRLLLFSAFILFILAPILSFSQTYKVDEMRIYSWNNLTIPEGWEQNTTEQYTYGNGGNKETRILGLEYPSLNKDYQHNKTYNTNNDILLTTRQSWDGSAWEDDSKDDYTYYPGTSNVKDITTFSFALGHDASKISYEYSGTDVTAITIQYWDAGGLKNMTKFDYTYNFPGQGATELESEWVAEAWKPKEKSFASYSTDKRTVQVYKYVSGVLAAEPFDQYITTYSGGLEIEYLWQSWDGAAWVNNDRELSTYDANNNKRVYILDETFSDPSVGYYKEERDYSVAAPLSTVSFENENFKVYPNPASDVINIASSFPVEKMELFDILGKKVMSSFFIKQLNIENLKSGMYVLKVFSNNQSAIKRIVIK